MRAWAVSASFAATLGMASSAAESAEALRWAIAAMQGSGAMLFEQQLRAELQRLGVNTTSMPQPAAKPGALRYACRGKPCDVVVQGRVTVRRGQASISLSLTDARTLKRFASMRQRYPSLPALVPFCRRLAVNALRRYRSAAVRSSTTVPTKARRASRPKPPEPSLAGPRSRRLVLRSRGEGTTLPTISRRPYLRQTTARPLLSTFFGFGLAARRLLVSSAEAGEKASYAGSAYPEFTIQLAAYPLTPLTPGHWRNLGLGIAYSRDLSVSSTVDSPTHDKLQTSAQELLLDLRFAWDLELGSSRPQLMPIVGWGFRDFTLSDNAALASFNYRFLRVGIAASLPLWRRYLALDLGFELRPLLSSGKSALRAYGSRRSGLAIALRPGLSGQHRSGFFYRLSAEYLRYGATYSGLAASGFEQRADSADRAVATRTTDQFLRVWLGGGYSL